VWSDISAKLQNRRQFSDAFEEEANFCAGASQIHTHSPTCVKYSLSRPKGSRELCRFKAPWKLVEKTAFTEGGVLEIRRNHSMVNRWNKAMAVGLRHNHDISFIATQRKTMAVVFYVTNYATKLEDPVWKRVAAASEVLGKVGRSVERSYVDGGQRCAIEDGRANRTRQFLMKVANRVFTERPLSHVEVIANLLGYGTEFSNSDDWTYVNVSFLYWHIFRRWYHLRCASGSESTDSVEEMVFLEKCGQRVSLVQAYEHRGAVLRGLSLYDYLSVVKLKRKRKGGADDEGHARGELQLDSRWPPSEEWVQVLRKPGKHAAVCIDGYLSMDFEEEDDACYKRYVWSF
jgi:hypothetical protein